MELLASPAPQSLTELSFDIEDSDIGGGVGVQNGDIASAINEAEQQFALFLQRAADSPEPVGFPDSVMVAYETHIDDLRREQSRLREGTASIEFTGITFRLGADDGNALRDELATILDSTDLDSCEVDWVPVQVLPFAYEIEN